MFIPNTNSFTGSKTTRVSPEANWIGNAIASDITELVVPSNNFNGMLGIRKGVKLCFRTKADSMKQSVEPESTSALKEAFGTDSEVKGTINKLDKERIEEHNEVVLILTILLALVKSTQSPESAGIEESRTNFLLERPGFQWLLHRLSWIGGICGPYGQIGHRGGRDLGPCDVDVPAV